LAWLAGVFVGVVGWGSSSLPLDGSGGAGGLWGGADDLQRVWDVEGAEGLLRSGSGWGGDAGLAGMGSYRGHGKGIGVAFDVL
jgi:hypothetical protein